MGPCCGSPRVSRSLSKILTRSRGVVQPNTSGSSKSHTGSSVFLITFVVASTPVALEPPRVMLKSTYWPREGGSEGVARIEQKAKPYDALAD